MDAVMDEATFSKALYDNDVDTVRRGLDESPALLHASIEYFGPSSPIRMAAHRGQTEMVMLLADRGANLEGVLDSAYAGSNPETAMALILRGAIADPKHPEREIERFKAFISGDYMFAYDAYYDQVDKAAAAGITPEYGFGDKPDSFDRIIRQIREDGKYRQLAKKIPGETIKGGGANPEFLAFGAVLQQAFIVSHNCMHLASGDRDTLVPQLLENSYQSNWKESAKRLKLFTTGEALQLKDALEHFADVVVMPEMARKTRNLLTSGKIDIKQLREMILPEVARVIVGNRSLPVVFDLQRDWHADETTLEAAIRDPKYARQGAWLPFTPDFTAASGLTISFVTDAPTLDKLGKDESHCVGGYASKCMREPVHIGVVKDGDKVLSTFELNEGRNKEADFVIRQHMRKHNAAVEDHSPEGIALKEFVHAVRSRAVKVDFEALRTRREKNVKEADDVRQICGFDPFYTEKTAERGDEKTGPERETNALHQYLNVITGGRDGRIEGQVPSVISSTRNSFVPGGREKWGRKTAAQFLEETGLMEQIDRMVDKVTSTKAEQTGNRGWAVGE
jgi:hypothetical protein